MGPNICKTTAPSQVSPLAYMGSRINDSIFIEPTTEAEVCKLIMSLKHSAPGWDGLSAKVMKQSYGSLLKPLTHVLNRSLTLGGLPFKTQTGKGYSIV